MAGATATIELVSDVPRQEGAVRIGARDGDDLVERLAQRHFGITAAEFARRWHAGELRADEHPKATEIALLLPLVEEH